MKRGVIRIKRIYGDIVLDLNEVIGFSIKNHELTVEFKSTYSCYVFQTPNEAQQAFELLSTNFN